MKQIEGSGGHGDWKRGRVFGLGSEVHYMVVGSLRPNMPTAPSPLPPQLLSPNLDDWVARLKDWMQQMDPTWPDPPAPQPPADPRYPTTITNTRLKGMLI
ncbi:UNVERIFIED_CONTAM: hypothetical protein Sradi_1348200 [Sesamum radiatum]|uniref:Uncharacterized protein n=1 Tax=Sesamum radiatum TaxID=300843 RepID=A0AAW2URE0_SESRA